MDKVQVTPDNVNDYLCVRIFGGLGNQMFQYAAACAQANRLGVRLLMHSVGSERLEHASFGLAPFPIDAALWDQDATAPALADRLLGRARRKRKHGLDWPGPRFEHDGLTVNPAIEGIGTGTYLSGYFQSEDYFACCADVIRYQFSLDHLDAALDAKSAALVRAPGSVSVHIRRGDYLHDPKVLKIHGLMEDDYYNAAARLIRRLVPDCHFCIFSDDREAADTLTRHWPNRTVMPEADRMHDLALMSRCEHHIIANSSFSWWGAWLEASPEKLVIGPRRWYSREHMQTTYTDDICPKGWILI